MGWSKPLSRTGSILGPFLDRDLGRNLLSRNRNAQDLGDWEIGRVRRGLIETGPASLYGLSRPRTVEPLIRHKKVAREGPGLVSERIHGPPIVHRDRCRCLPGPPNL